MFPVCVYFWYVSSCLYPLGSVPVFPLVLVLPALLLRRSALSWENCWIQVGVLLILHQSKHYNKLSGVGVNDCVNCRFACVRFLWFWSNLCEHHLIRLHRCFLWNSVQPQISALGVWVRLFRARWGARSNLAMDSTNPHTHIRDATIMHCANQTMRWETGPQLKEAQV